MEPWGPLYHRTSRINRNETTESNQIDRPPSPIEPQNSANQKNLNFDLTNNSDETTGSTRSYKPIGHIAATRFNCVQDPICLSSHWQLKYSVQRMQYHGTIRSNGSNRLLPVTRSSYSMGSRESTGSGECLKSSRSTGLSRSTKSGGQQESMKQFEH